MPESKSVKRGSGPRLHDPMEKLAAVIETLIAAARGGELDDVLKAASKQGPFRKARKAGDNTDVVPVLPKSEEDLT
jgi:hypothetical protein